MDNELYHWGIKGMKWGIRRYQNKDGSLTPEGEKRYGDGESKGDSGESGKSGTTSTSAKKTKSIPEHISKKQLKSMTAEEIKARIDRLNLESELRKLENTVYPTRGKKFVMDVLEKSGKNVAEQAVTLAMGTAVNKVLQEVLGSKDAKYKTEQFINPKKGQKDK